MRSQVYIQWMADLKRVKISLCGRQSELTRLSFFDWVGSKYHDLQIFIYYFFYSDELIIPTHEVKGDTATLWKATYIFNRPRNPPACGK